MPFCSASFPASTSIIPPAAALLAKSIDSGVAGLDAVTGIVSDGLSPRVLSVMEWLLLVLLVSVLPFSSRLLQETKIAEAIKKHRSLLFIYIIFIFPF